MVALEFLFIYQRLGLPPGLLEPRLGVFATFPVAGTKYQKKAT